MLTCGICKEQLNIYYETTTDICGGVTTSTKLTFYSKQTNLLQLTSSSAVQQVTNFSCFQKARFWSGTTLEFLSFGL